MRGGKRKNTRVKGQIETGPGILRNSSFECVMAIVDYIHYKTGEKDFNIETALITIKVLDEMCT